MRVLRENRRVVTDENRREEIEEFHKVLMNVSEGKATQRVRDFIVQAYVRGALSCGNNIENIGIEGSTAVFTKRLDFRRPPWRRSSIATPLPPCHVLGAEALQRPMEPEGYEENCANAQSLAEGAPVVLQLL